MTELKSHLDKFPIWLPILLLGVITFVTWELTISSDLKEYMCYAINLMNKNGYTDINGSPLYFRAPLFPLLISVSYRVFGVSLNSAFVVVRLFCILNPIIVYFLGKKFFNKTVGISVSLLVLTSYPLNWASYRHIDAVWPAFVLLHLLFFYQYLEYRKRIDIFVAGILIGVGYCFKQSALLFFPLPLLFLIFKQYQDRKMISDIIGYFILILLIIVPWISYVYFHTSDLRLAIIGTGKNHIISPSGTTTGYYFLISYFNGLYKYFFTAKNSLANNFILYPVFIISWLFVFYKLFAKSKSYALIAFSFILLTPYIANVGDGNLRIGHLIIFYLLTYLAVGSMAWNFCSMMAKKSPKGFSEKTTRKVLAILIFLLVIVQMLECGDIYKGNLRFLKQSIFFNWHSDCANRENSKLIKKDLKVFLSRAENYIQDNPNLLVDSRNLARTLFIGSKGKYRAKYLPFIGLNPDKKLMILTNYDINKSELPIFAAANGRIFQRSFRLMILYKSHVDDLVAANQIKYLIISSRWKSLANFFLESSNYELIIESPESQAAIEKYYLLKVVSARQSQNNRKEQTIFDSYLKESLKEMKEKDNNRFQSYLKIFREYTGTDLIMN